MVLNAQAEVDLSLVGSQELINSHNLCCRLLHLILLGMNVLAVQLLSAVSGREKSVFSKKENARALIIVSSQVSYISSKFPSKETVAEVHKMDGSHFICVQGANDFASPNGHSLKSFSWIILTL